MKDFTIELDGKEVSLYFKRPNQKQLFAIDMQYRKIYSEAIRAGIMTEAEAKERFQESGAWTKVKEQKVNELSLRVAQLEAVLRESQDKDGEEAEKERMELVEELSQKRSDLITMLGERIELMQNTAEGLANMQRIHKLAELCCTRKEDDEPFFSHYSYEDFASSYHDAMSEIYKQAYLFEYQIPEDMSQDWEEMKYIKKMQEKEQQETEKKDTSQTTQKKKKTSTKGRGRKKKVTRKTG